jgi:hypothetical protein
MKPEGNLGRGRLSNALSTSSMGPSMMPPALSHRTFEM